MNASHFSSPFVSVLIALAPKKPLLSGLGGRGSFCLTSRRVNPAIKRRDAAIRYERRRRDAQRSLHQTATFRSTFPCFNVGLLLISRYALHRRNLTKGFHERPRTGRRLTNRRKSERTRHSSELTPKVKETRLLPGHCPITLCIANTAFWWLINFRREFESRFCVIVKAKSWPPSGYYVRKFLW